MIRFLFGNLLIGIMLIFWNWPTRLAGKLALDRNLALILLLCIVPLLSTWITASVVNRLSPRKIFLPGRPFSLSPFLRGSAAGAFCFLLAVACVTYLLPKARWLSEGLMIAACSTIATSLVILCSPRSRPGLCRRCDYDLRFSLAHGRCPECGTTI